MILYCTNEVHSYTLRNTIFELDDMATVKPGIVGTSSSNLLSIIPDVSVGGKLFLWTLPLVILQACSFSFECWLKFCNSCLEPVVDLPFLLTEAAHGWVISSFASVVPSLLCAARWAVLAGLLIVFAKRTQVCGWCWCLHNGFPWVGEAPCYQPENGQCHSRLYVSCGWRGHWSAVVFEWWWNPAGANDAM